jgi:hypothetical protein
MTSAVDVAQAWGRAMDDFDEEALVALAHEEIEIVTPGDTKRGRDGLRGWLTKQTYGAVPHFERRRAFARDGTVVVELRVELRYVDGGEVAGSMDSAAVFVVEDGLVRRITMHPNLEPALSAAGLGEADEFDLA